VKEALARGPWIPRDREALERRRERLARKLDTVPRCLVARARTPSSPVRTDRP
jgi:hypothetical protein